MPHGSEHGSAGERPSYLFFKTARPSRRFCRVICWGTLPARLWSWKWDRRCDFVAFAMSSEVDTSLAGPMVASHSELTPDSMITRENERCLDSARHDTGFARHDRSVC